MLYKFGTNLVQKREFFESSQKSKIQKEQKEKLTTFKVPEIVIEAVAAIAALISALKWW